MSLQEWFVRHGETAQYVGYFAMLALMGSLEGIRTARPRAAKRWTRWRTNFALTALNIVALGALPTSFVAAAEFTDARGLGLLNLVALPLPVVFTVGMLARGFVSWLTHLLMHRVPLFWRVHRVHHTDTELDVSTTVRFHPLEFPIGLLVGLPFVLTLGLPPWVLLAYEILDVVVTVFSHANVALPPAIERALRHVIVTPGLHRVHHSVLPEEADSNFSAVFPIWDLVFGTLRATTRGPLSGMRFGVAEVRDRRSASLAWLLGVPFRNELGRDQWHGASRDRAEAS